MVPISEEIWREILNNQKFPLHGTNEPNNGNGYHDGISWKTPYMYKKNYDEEFSQNSFNTIYLRDLGVYINPSYSRSNEFEEGLKISNYSANYSNTLFKYLSTNSYYRQNHLLEVLGKWGEMLSRNGRVVFEIIGWHDNKTKQFYGYQLNLLDNDYCTINKAKVIYKAPHKTNGEKIIFKKVIIPRDKCIIIEFPKELGGYKGFIEKTRKVKKLGSKFNFSEKPLDRMNNIKNWDEQFNKIVTEWGASSHLENVTDFYQILSSLRFRYMVISCTHELVDGFNQLVSYLNIKLNEKVSLEFNLKNYNKEDFKEMQRKWLNGELSFKDANKILIK